MLHEFVLKRKYQEAAKLLHGSAMGIEEHPELNAQDHEGNTPIHLAASLNDREMIEILLGAGAKLHIKNKKGSLAKEISSALAIRKKLSDAELVVAAWNNDIKRVQELVQNGANPSDEVSVMTLSGIQGKIIRLHPTPVSAAAYKKNEAIIKFFKNNNKNIEFAEDARPYKDRYDGLLEAIEDHNIPAIKGLVGCFGHKVNCTVRGGGYNGAKYQLAPTPLSYAVRCGNIEVIKLLVALGATLDEPNALALAKRSQNIEIKRLFNLLSQEPPKQMKASEAEEKLSLETKLSFEAKLSTETKLSSERSLIIYDEGMPQFQRQVMTFLFRQFLSQTTVKVDDSKNVDNPRSNEKAQYSHP